MPGALRYAVRGIMIFGVVVISFLVGATALLRALGYFSLQSFPCVVGGLGTAPFPDLRSQLLAYFGQQLFAHAAIIFAILTALFAFIVVVVYKVETRPQSVFYTVVVGFLFTALFYVAVRMVLYGYLQNAVIHSPYDQTAYGWNMSAYLTCDVGHFYLSTHSALQPTFLLERFSGLTYSDPFSGIFVAPFTGFIVARLSLHVLAAPSTKDGPPTYSSWPFAKSWVAIFVLVWIFAIIAPLAIPFSWIFYLIWGALAIAFVTTIAYAPG